MGKKTAKTAKTTRRNAQDLTTRNNNARKREHRVLVARVAVLAATVAALAVKVRRLSK